jgi:hypothetical protein
MTSPSVYHEGTAAAQQPSICFGTTPWDPIVRCHVFAEKIAQELCCKKTDLVAGLIFPHQQRYPYSRQRQFRSFDGLPAKATTDYALTLVNKDEAWTVN